MSLLRGVRTEPSLRPPLHAEVNISNDWLKQANSRNYHHFFPKAYLRRQGIVEDLRIMSMTLPVMFFRKGGW